MTMYQLRYTSAERLPNAVDLPHLQQGGTYYYTFFLARPPVEQPPRDLGEDRRLWYSLVGDVLTTHWMPCVYQDEYGRPARSEGATGQHQAFIPGTWTLHRAKIGEWEQIGYLTIIRGGRAWLLFDALRTPVRLRLADVIDWEAD